MATWMRSHDTLVRELPVGRDRSELGTPPGTANHPLSSSLDGQPTVARPTIDVPVLGTRRQ